MFQNLTKSDFFKNVLALITGTTIAQAIPIAITPILTRIYSPEEFGIYAVYMSMANLLSVAATGRLELAILAPKSEQDASNITALALTISLLFAIISFIFIFIFKTEIALLLGNPKVEPWLYFIPFSIILSSGYQCLNFWLNRNKEFKSISYGKVGQAAATSATNIGFKLSPLGINGLILGNLFGLLAGILIFLKKTFKTKFSPKLSKSQSCEYLKEHKKLIIFNLPNAIIDNFRTGGINILFSNIFGSTQLGFFSLGWKLVQVPSNIIASSIAQVFFQEISEVVNTRKKNFSPLLKNFIKKQFLLGLIPFIFIYFFSEPIFAFLLGGKWKNVGTIASLLSPWLMANFVSSPISFVYIVLKHQEKMLIFSIFYAIIPLGIIQFGSFNSIYAAVEVISWSLSVMLVGFIAYSYYLGIKFDQDSRL